MPEMAMPRGDVGAYDGTTREAAALEVTTIAGAPKANSCRNVLVGRSVPSFRKAQSVQVLVPASGGTGSRYAVIPARHEVTATMSALGASNVGTADSCDGVTADSGGTPIDAACAAYPHPRTGIGECVDTTSVHRPSKNTTGKSCSKPSFTKARSSAGVSFDVVRRSVAARQRGEPLPRSTVRLTSPDSATAARSGRRGGIGSVGTSSLKGYSPPSRTTTCKAKSYLVASTKSPSCASVSSGGVPSLSGSKEAICPLPSTSSPPPVTSAPLCPRPPAVAGSHWTSEANRRSPSENITDRCRTKAAAEARETLARSLYVMEERVRMLCEERFEAEGGRISDLEGWGDPQSQ
eukprot:TRINITY_DN54977_c0_g1_i1.p1 TRINITY_DN54977_c0_g1~~TRINITY_DN54977_c0_g1_i1.p1  ORF type:complete len:382 (+),score=52.08 TRINITY_DN54977_c0_g1_i1:97-1146(+)